MLKISTYNPTNHVVFGNKQSLISSAKVASLSGSSTTKANSLKTVVKDILSRFIQAPEKFLLENKNLLGVGLKENAITYLLNDKSLIKFSLPKGLEEKFFEINYTDINSNIQTLILDDSRIVKSFSDNEKPQYLEENGMNHLLANNFVDDIYDKADEKLFEIRMWARRIQPEVISKPIRTTRILPKEQRLEEKTPQVEIKDFSFQELLKKSIITPQKLPSRTPKRENKPRKDCSVIIHNGRTLRRLNPKPVKVQKVRIEKPKPQKEPIIKPIIEKIVAPKIVQSKTVKKPTFNIGVLSQDLKSKVENIITLKSQIIEIVEGFASTTLTRINNINKDGVFVSRKKIALNDEFILFEPKRRDYPNQEILNIRDLNEGRSINIFDKEKIAKNEIKWNYKGALPKVKYMSDAELNNLVLGINLSSKLDSIVEKLQSYTGYLLKKGWHSQEPRKISAVRRTSHKRRIRKDNPAYINSEILTKVENLGKKFIQIREELSKYSTTKRVVLKYKYPTLNRVPSSRLEFNNIENDGYNLSFDLTKMSQGEFTKIVKLKSDTEIKEVYLINKDGRIVKNFGSKHIYNIFPTSSKAKLFYYSAKELAENNVLENLQTHIETLEKVMDDYYNFLLSCRK